jgi:hypothetical protein
MILASSQLVEDISVHAIYEHTRKKRIVLVQSSSWRPLALSVDEGKHFPEEARL